jgi:MtN3 and saliva related transmembrane protein
MGFAPLSQIRRIAAGAVLAGRIDRLFLILLFGFMLWIGYGAVTAIRALVIPNAIALCVGVAAVMIALALRRESGAGRL